MISAGDIVRVPYSPDLTEAGIAYARHALLHPDRNGGSGRTDRLQRLVAGAAVDLAFRRFLGGCDVPFEVRGSAPFGNLDRYDISLRGQRCTVWSFLVSDHSQIAALHADPAVALAAKALVPLDHHTAGDRFPDDIYVFALLAGRTAASTRDGQMAPRAGEPVFLVHAMPRKWSRPRIWMPLGPLVLKCRSALSQTVELGGQDAHGQFATCTVELPARTRLQLDQDFHTLSYIHVEAYPRGLLGIHSPTLGETYIIEPGRWKNIWVYGLHIYLVGWIRREEFQRRAKLIPVGARVFQLRRTRTANLAVAASDLKPLGALIERMKDSG